MTTASKTPNASASRTRLSLREGMILASILALGILVFIWVRTHPTEEERCMEGDRLGCWEFAKLKWSEYAKEGNAKSAADTLVSLCEHSSDACACAAAACVYYNKGIFGAESRRRNIYVKKALKIDPSASQRCEPMVHFIGCYWPMSEHGTED